MKTLFFLFLISSSCYSQTHGSGVTDIDGNQYATVVIGSQEWMAENLNVERFRNGDLIPQAKSAEEWWKAGVNKQPAWCYYNNEVKNGTVYGKLYNWFAVVDPRGLAPIGWHIPSFHEWQIVIEFLGSNYAVYVVKQKCTNC